MKILKSVFLIMLAITILWNQSWLPKPTVNADSLNGISISTTTDVPSVKSGRTFTYRIGFSFSGLDYDSFDFSKLKIVVPIPAGVVLENEVSPNVISGRTFNDNDSDDTNGREYVYSFNTSPKPLEGSSYTMQVNAHYLPHVTFNGISTMMTAKIISVDGGVSTDIVPSNPVTVIAEAAADWELVKSKSSPIPTPMAGGDVQYELFLNNKNSSTNEGVLNIENVYIEDMLPPEASFVSASGGLTYNSVTHSVYMTAGAAIQDDVRYYVNVSYPPDILVPDITKTVTNIANVTYNALGTDPIANKIFLTDDVTHGFTTTPTDNGVGGFHKSRNARQQEISPGQDVSFTIGGFSNGSNGNYTNAEIIDITPTQDTLLNQVYLDLKSIQTATFRDAGPTYEVYYATDIGASVWSLWPAVTVDSTVSQTLNVSSLGLPAGVYVTGIKFVFPNTLPVSFTQLTNYTMTYSLRDPYPGAVIDGQRVVNKATLNYQFNAIPVQVEDDADVYLWDDRPLVRIDKSRIGNGPYKPGDVVEFQIAVSNSEYSSDLFHDPIVFDVLPAGFTYQSWSLHEDTNFDASTLALDVSTPNFDGAGKTLLRWKFPGAVMMPVNSSFVIRVTAKADPYTAATTYTNIAGLTTNSAANPIFHDYYFDPFTTETLDLDGDGGTGDLYIDSSATVTINKLPQLGSYKRVRGELDTDGWKEGRLPAGCILGQPCDTLAKTVAGGRVDYKLTVKNESNFDVDNIVVVDVLPRVGDEGVLTGARGSTWGTVLTEALPSLPGNLALDYTVYYHTATNVKMSTSTGWSATPPADLTTVTALKFEFTASKVLLPGEELPIVWTMKAPAGTDEDKIAWNSFGHQAIEVGAGGMVLEPAEPPKVGVYIKSDTGLSLGDYVWADLNENGIQDEAPKYGVNGVKVELLDSAGNPYVKILDDDGVPTGYPVTTITGPDEDGNPGYYLFTTLPAGDYRVRFTMPTLLPEDYEYGTGADAYTNSANHFTAWTKKGEGSDLAEDSNVGGVGASDPTLVVTTDIINLTANDLKIDAGLVPPLGAIGNYVWYDADGDGIQDGGENGISGIDVDLYKEVSAGVWAIQGTPDTTDINGKYEFTGLLPGNYKVKFPKIVNTDIDADTIAEDVIISFKGRGTNRTLDSNANDVESATSDGSIPAASLPHGFSDVIALQLGEINHTIDTGYVLPASIGDYVWVDLDDDGDHSGLLAENPAYTGGLTVKLLKNNNSAVKHAGTNLTKTTPVSGVDTGKYLFDHLLPGIYKVEFELPATGYAFARPNIGGNDSLDSDTTSRTDGKTAAYTLSPGEFESSVDAGLVELVSLGDFVWRDNDGDGVQAATGEPGVSGVVVNLYDKESATPTTVFKTTTTAADGKYEFANLIPGDYTVEFIRPDGYLFTGTWQGGDDEKDSNANSVLPEVTNSVTDLITLMPGIDNPTIDAGLIPLASVGDVVWRDLNDDGQQGGALETGVSGVMVELLDAANADAIVDEDAYGNTFAVVTDTDGKYLFENLLQGNYKVKFTLPDGYWFTAELRGASATDSNAVQQAGNPTDPAIGIAPVTLSIGEADLTIDAGVLSLASIGDRVWVDTNGDGVQDASEIGQSGVTVELFAANGTTQITVDAYGNDLTNEITDADGLYGFNNLLPGDYRVKFSDLPAGYEFTLRGIDSTDNPDKDSDADPNPLIPAAFGMTQVVALTWGQHYGDLDAGILSRTELGNFVWMDLDEDGIQDLLEPGVEGVKVNLLYDDGNPVIVNGSAYTLTTDEDGLYMFTNLWPDDFIVEFELPSDRFIFSPRNTGVDDAVDSDAHLATGQSPVVNLASGEKDYTLDAGLIELVSVGDKLWDDQDNDGIQDATEPGYSGIIVHLLDGSDAPISVGGVPVTDTTDTNGNYLFEKLQPGTYKVKFELPAGYMFAKKNVVSGTAATDSDVDPATGVTDAIVLLTATHNMNVDAGIVKLSSLGDFVWMDRDLDDFQDSGEIGVSGVKVHLLDSSNNPIQVGGVDVIATTDVNGSYLFELLVPGTYKVRFELPSGYVFAVRGAGADVTLDSNANPANGLTDAIVLAPGEINRSIDAGLIKLVDLGDTLWLDTGVIGMQESEPVDPVIVGATVSLLDENSDPILAGGIPVTTTTDAGGKYLFADLYPGKYRVKFDLPATYLFTKKLLVGTGITTTNDSNVGIDGTTDVIELTAGMDDLTVDAGIVIPASLGDYVWSDVNMNGIQDTGEVGNNDVKVELFAEDGTLIGTTLTADNGGLPGFYSFTNLVPGKYKVKFTVIPGYMFTLKGAGTAANNSDVGFDGNTELITLQPGDNNLNIDAGLHVIPSVPKADIGNYVWIDNNANGIQDTGETGQNNVTVELYNALNALVSTTVTSNEGNKGAGYYSFKNLIPGNYSIKFILSTGYEFTRTTIGDDKALDSNANVEGSSGTVTLNPGDNNLTIDAGLIPLAAVGNYVWLDINKNGIQGATEAGQNGIEVTLYNDSGIQIASAITENGPNGAGYYEFKDLKPGKYTILFDLPEGYEFTKTNAGSSRATDSNADENGETGIFVLLPGDRILTIDAGLYRVSEPEPEPEEEEESVPETGSGNGSNPGAGNAEDGSASDGKSGVPKGELNGNGKGNGASHTNALPKTGESMPLLPIVGYGLSFAALALLTTRWVIRRKLQNERH